VAIVVVILVMFWDRQPSPDPRLLQVHHGIWTDENGAPGNRICFWQVIASPNSPITAIEGRVRVKDFLNRAAADGVWNFENWEPLRLNVVFQVGTYTAAVQQVDPNHLLIRFCPSSDVQELHKADWFAHPDTVRLTRVTDEPYPPKEPAKLWF
jgi:hypothetical protein